MMEIERKYLAGVHVKHIPTYPEKYLHIEQGYLLARRNVEWRLRRTEYHIPKRGVVWTTTVKIGNGFSRGEYDFRIPAFVGRMLSWAVPRFIVKTRIHNDGWEFDIFGGDLMGLMLAEIELASEDAALPPVPAWIRLDQDVTDSGTYANKNLSRLSSAAAARLTQRITPYNADWFKRNVA